ncbi:MAG: N-acetylneuraminate synthase family protein [Chloroflexi bacterium]|nr:N-acetylneuraminate synthase family protein [Chloroflexota bacterium]
MRDLQVGHLTIGPGHPVAVIAEYGVNHNGDAELARRMAIAAADTGAHIVKGQAFRAEEMVLPSSPGFARLKALELPQGALAGVAREVHARGAIWTASVFDTASADLVEALGSPVFKVASGELTNTPLLQYVARKGRPLLISVGMAFLGEIEEALEAVYGTGNHQVALLHCVSAYPTEAAEANLARIPLLKELFQVPVGFSDHTIGLAVPIAAVALGADLIEKHFTLDKTLPGPDQALSVEPGELRALVNGVQAARRAIGSPASIGPTAGEREVRYWARKGLYARRDIPEGTALTEADIVALRPADGLAPRHYKTLLGRRTRCPLRAGEPITWDAV